MPRYAAIDIGSNSVRMLAAETPLSSKGVGPFTILAEDRQVTRLGESVFREGRFSNESIDLVCGNLRRMAQIYRKFDIASVRAVATAATRDASNQREFLDRASEALGAEVEVISGQEEARLIHLGVQSRWPSGKGRHLLVDVGGGSAEIMLSVNGRLEAAWSKPLGAVRLTEVFLNHQDPPRPQDLRNLEQYIDEKLQPALAGIGRAPFVRMIATSATAAGIVCGVNRIPRARRVEADRKRASRTQLRRFYQLVAGKSVAARRKITGLGPRRAEIIVAGAAVFSRVLELFEHPSLFYLAAGVREGIIADLAARGAGRERTHLSPEQRSVVEKMVRKYGGDLRHARLIAALSHRLFDGLREVHQLPIEYARLVEAAAYLLDIGHFVSDTGHHKHAAYLVENSDLPGFTDAERTTIAMLCRFHRKSMPAPRHTEFQALPAETKRTILRMIPIVRLADSLDQGNEQNVDSVTCSVADGAIQLNIQAHGGVSLEAWAAERLSSIFQQVFGVSVRASAPAKAAR